MDSTNEYLESTGTVEIPTKWKEYSPPNTVRVVVTEEQEDIVDVGHIGLDRGEGPNNNLHKANGATIDQSNPEDQKLHKTHGTCRQEDSDNGATSPIEVPNNNLHKTRGACRQEGSANGATMQKSSQLDHSNLH